MAVIPITEFLCGFPILEITHFHVTIVTWKCYLDSSAFFRRQPRLGNIFVFRRQKEGCKKKLDVFNFMIQSNDMQSNWPEQNLQVIRTLMERSAVYRRALAPIMLMAGAVGTLAALAGWKLKLDQPLNFFRYWSAISVLVLVPAFLMVRRQALQAKEPVWSPPTRRVIQALLPACVVGFGLVLVMVLTLPSLDNLTQALTWIMIYGCGLHAAGFFMPRGIKLLGWIFIIGAGALVAWCLGMHVRLPPDSPHFVMGFFFGGLHLAYGIYLYFTEQKSNET